MPQHYYQDLEDMLRPEQRFDTGLTAAQAGQGGLSAGPTPGSERGGAEFERLFEGKTSMEAPGYSPQADAELWANWLERDPEGAQAWADDMEADRVRDEKMGLEQLLGEAKAFADTASAMKDVADARATLAELLGVKKMTAEEMGKQALALKRLREAMKAGLPKTQPEAAAFKAFGFRPEDLPGPEVVGLENVLNQAGDALSSAEALRQGPPDARDVVGARTVQLDDEARHARAPRYDGQVAYALEAQLARQVVP